jgi:hypothetical protein
VADAHLQRWVEYLQEFQSYMQDFVDCTADTFSKMAAYRSGGKGGPDEIDVQSYIVREFERFLRRWDLSPQAAIYVAARSCEYL